MGGSSKKQKVGNRYHYGVHIIPCRKADAVLAIDLAEKRAWTGDQGDGYIEINKQNLFGGDEREGGFVGRIAVMLGKATQQKNSYLSSVLGPLVPAFRGAVSLVFERPYFNANSARLPAIKTKLVNVEDIHRGWLPEKAVVNVTGDTSSASIFIAFDVSLSMAGSRLATQASALGSFIRSLKGKKNSIRAVAHSGAVNGSIERFDCSDSDYEDIATWIEGFTTLSSGGRWDHAVASAPAFFTNDSGVTRDFNLESLLGSWGGVFGSSPVPPRRKIVIFTSDGEPEAGSPSAARATLDTIPDVETYGFNIELANTTSMEVIDNTPRDGVPVVSGSDPGQLLSALNTAFRTWVDLNPAHIQRCLLIDPMRGGTASPSDIGDSFEVAADLYLDEEFGLSVSFSGADSNVKDRSEIDRHVGAVTYKSRVTGKWEHEPLRDGFDINLLPVLDNTIVKDWSNLRKQAKTEVPNVLTVVYTKRENGEPGSITRSNPIAVRERGRRIQGDPINYPFVTTLPLATRLLARDLPVLTEPIWLGELPLAFCPPDIELGSAIVVNNPDLRLENKVFRVNEIRRAEGTDVSCWIKLVEHKFDMGQNVPVIDIVDQEDTSPKASNPRLAMEAPYYELVIENGQLDTDTALSDNPLIGNLFVTGARANGFQVDANIGIDDGGGWTDLGAMDFTPGAFLLEGLTASADHTNVLVTFNSSMMDVEAGELAMIGDEVVRIDDMVQSTGGIIMTLGRGCLDTVPSAHSIGDGMVLFSRQAPLPTQYLDGESVDVKILSRAGGDRLTIAAAPTDTVTFDSRAIRPYPPGDFKVNGSYQSFRYVSDAVLTWAHRDRTVQTTPNVEDHTYADIGPEVGTTYQVRAEAFTSAGVSLGLITDTNVGGVNSYDWNDATARPDGTAYIGLSVTSIRGGYESWQSPVVYIMANGSELVRATHDDRSRVTSDGKLRIVEA